MFTKKPLIIKKTTVTVKRTPQPTPAYQPPPQKRSVPRPKPARVENSRSERYSTNSPAPSAKRKIQQRPSSATPDFGRDDDSSEEEHDYTLGDRGKRQKIDPLKLGLPKRNVLSVSAFEEEGKSLPIVHATDIPKLDKTTKFEPAFKGLSDNFVVEVQYPSASKKEKFLLVKPTSDSHGYQALEDITQTMHKVIQYYLPEPVKERLDNETTGIPQRLSRAVNKKSEAQVMEVIDEWNNEMTSLRKDGTIAETLSKIEYVTPDLAERIINQTFSRTVSLNLKYLHQYEAGTDNVYGELLPKFVSQILRDLRVSSDQIFVDLGSGVGNVVLQAALEAGCESWGCEMMEKYCEVADLQKDEFSARCQLWGLSLGDINLEKGDFLVNPRILDVLKRADVILVNNQVFTPKTNDSLTTLFLDLKEGARIVSLKSFVPQGHKISARNSDSVLNLLRVEQKEYFSKCVSWTDQGGNYYISTKDSTAVSKFHAQNTH